jgi:hypothetical protein
MGKAENQFAQMPLAARDPAFLGRNISRYTDFKTRFDVSDRFR